MTNTSKYNDVMYRRVAIYTKIEIEFSWLIQKDVVNHENQIGQQCDWLQRCDLRGI